MKPSGIGGQAVIEGVMMKSKDQYAVAVRKPDNEIVVEVNRYISKSEKIKLFKLPIFRGMLAFVETLGLGSKTLTYSAGIFEEEEEQREGKGKAEAVIMGITLIVAALLAAGIFIVLPVFAANLLSGKIESAALTVLAEGLIRILLFVLYVFFIFQLKDIKRVFMYHGAEHKTINCLEQGFELTVENVKWQSKEHRTCDTGFVFTVLFISVICFIFIRVDAQWLRYIFRILLIPVAAGIVYELISFADKSDSKVVAILGKPGMWWQSLTTKEPDDGMIEVAIKSVEAVFDWKDFLGIEDSIQNTDVKKAKNTRQSRKSTAIENEKVSKNGTSVSKKTNNRTNQHKETLNSNKSSASVNNKNSKKAANKTSSNQQPKKSLLMEEEDEILKALEDIVASKEASLDKE